MRVLAFGDLVEDLRERESRNFDLGDAGHCKSAGRGVTRKSQEVFL
jgi:hypothetical protein